MCASIRSLELLYISLLTSNISLIKGASQIVVRRNSLDSWVAEDRHSNDYVTPNLDESQDVELLFAEQSEDEGTSWGVVMKISNIVNHVDGQYHQLMMHI